MNDVVDEAHPDLEPVWLRHGHVDLALHHLREGSGPNLLVLHGLGERTPDAVPDLLAGWPGAVWGLDFTGHGRSTLPVGGGYTAEVLVADVDQALAHLGPCTIVGRGLGGYVAVLIAGARPDLVRGAVVLDGPGLAGGGPSPHSSVTIRALRSDTTPDPYALVELAFDVRPGDYATAIARMALEFSDLDAPVTVSATVRPPWLAAVAAEPGVRIESVGTALARYAAVPPSV